MEGPTPVSALIHAATMVTAGVYLVVRMHAVFMLAPMTLQVVGIIGAVTSLFAALCAISQTDLKRVLSLFDSQSARINVSSLRGRGILFGHVSFDNTCFY